MPEDRIDPSVPSFQIDHEELGVFLAEAFIRRVNAFDLDARIALLRACRLRLAAEAGPFQQFLLSAGEEPTTSLTYPPVEMAVL